MGMAGYTKLFNSILASTIWRANDKTRIVWITLLAMADKDGICEGSIPGLADLSRVSIQDCEAALEELSSPDPYSRTSDHEGRRIEAIDGVGWRLLNHAKYRAKMSEDERREYNRQKQAEWRAKRNQGVNECQDLSITVNDSQSQSAMSAHTEAQAQAQAFKKESVSNETAIVDPFLKTSSSEESQSVWSRGARLLGGDSARPLIGKKIKECGEEAVAQALAVLELKNPADPKAFFVACLKPKESYNFVRNQPSQREAIAEEQERIRRELGK